MTLAESRSQRRPLLQRRLDCFYFAYFSFHILNFLCIDGQSFWPEQVVPHVLRRVKLDYLQDSGDPFLIAFDNGDVRYTWFAVSVYTALIVQNPIFVLAVMMLWRDDKRVYPLLAVYGILASTTTAQCLASVLWGSESAHLSAANVSFLTKAYTPFVVIPLVLLIDMTARCVSIIDRCSRQDLALKAV